MLKDNPHDTYDLVLSTYTLASDFVKKVLLFANSGLALNLTISLTASDPLPSSVLQYMRIQRATESELATIDSRTNKAHGRVTARNEREVLDALREEFGNVLDGFSRPAVQLEAMIKYGIFESGGKEWMAAIVSIGEQRIVRRALQEVERLRSLIEPDAL